MDLFFYRSKLSQGLFQVLILLLVLASCSSNENGQVASDLDYYPLRVGKTWLYDVEESSTLRTSCPDNGVTTSTYEWQMKVVDSFPNTDRGLTYSIQNSKRTKPTDAWTPVSTWTAQVINSKIIVNESNINYVKLVIPLTANLTWNGNLFNTRIELNGSNQDNYVATLVGQPYKNSSGVSFDRTVTVVQNDEQNNIIYRDSRLEVYAYQVGLVYKESFLLNYFANSQLPCYAQKKTQQGTTFKQSLKEFTK